MSGSVVHFEVPYDDAERAQRFYAEAFGWNVQPIPELDYTSVSTGDVDERGMPTSPGYIGGGMYQRTEQLPGPMITIAVDDIASAFAAIEQAGGSRVQEPVQVADMGWAAYFKDPEGNIVGLWQNASPG